MNTQELLQQLRDKGWGDTAIGEALGVSYVTVYRWRMGQRSPENEKPVMEALRRLLRRKGPPIRKEPAVI
jgi:hypothetical protein